MTERHHHGRGRGAARGHVLALLLAGTSAAQVEPRPDPAPAADQEEPLELERVLAELRRAHGSDAPAAATDRFQGKLQIVSTDRAEDRITFTLDVRFRHPTLIRYMVDERDRRIERGRDELGSWVRLAPGDEAVSAATRNFEGDRAELSKHIGLARQLLRYLDPAAVAQQLEDPAVRREELRISARKAVSCITITGVAESFPLFTGGGDPQRARLKLWIDAASHRLIAVEAFPLDAGGDPAPTGELVYMPEHELQQGVLLPTTLVFDRIDRERRREGVAKVRLLQLELDPELPPEKFARGEPW